MPLVPKALIQATQKLIGIEVMFTVVNLVTVDADGQILGHFTGFHRLDANRFQLVAEGSKFLIPINFGPKF